MGVSGTSTYTVDGGSPPYRVSSSNTNVAAAGINESTLTVIAGATAGTAQILVFDSTGTQVVIALTVGSATAPGLYTSAPSAITLASGGAAAVYQIGGGVPPYATSSGNATVASSTLTGVTLTISPGSSGSGTIVVLDSTGTKVEIAVTVPVVVGSTMSVLPNSANGNAGDTLTFAITGGIDGYTATSNNNSIATVSLSGSTITVALLNAGTTTITVGESGGQVASIPLTVSAAASQIRISPSAFVIGEDSTTPVTLSIYGGKGPYRTLSGDLRLAGVPAGDIGTSSSTKEKFDTTVGTNGSRCVTASDTTGSVSLGTYAVTLTVLDSLGSTATSIMTIQDNASTCMSLSPSIFAIGEGDATNYLMTASGGTGPYTATTNNSALASVAVAGTTITISPGTNGNRCIASGSYDVTITVTDILGKTALGTVTIKDDGIANNAACLQLSPNTLTLTEKNTADQTFTVSGGTAPYIVSTSDATLTGGVPFGTISGPTFTTTLGGGNRCIVPVAPNVSKSAKLTITDALGKVASATVIVNDDPAGCP
jgi:hypothetical protein